ncbi:hypothetical protein ACH5RR_028324 [Cinchona calisaya]|uniref:Uncharacterized protein n=1 Tax=Cinchona calisaya TaxID=153742 RepID=A0ABD2YTQ7_9GENT
MDTIAPDLEVPIFHDYGAAVLLGPSNGIVFIVTRQDIYINLPLSFPKEEEELFVQTIDGQLISGVLRHCQQLGIYDVYKHYSGGKFAPVGTLDPALLALSTDKHQFPMQQHGIVCADRRSGRPEKRASLEVDQVRRRKENQVGIEKERNARGAGWLNKKEGKSKI